MKYLNLLFKFIYQKIRYILPVKNTGKCLFLVCVIYVLMLILLESNILNFIPDPHQIVQQRYSILLVLLTLQIPTLIFLFEINSRIPLARKVIFTIYEFKKLFYLLIIAIFIIILLKWLWVILLVMTVLILLNMKYFNIAYDLATGSKVQDELLEYGLSKIVSRIWEQERIDDCGHLIRKQEEQLAR